MLPFDVSDKRFSDTAGLLMLRHRRSSCLRSSALAATWGKIRVLALLCFLRVYANLRDPEALNQ